MANRGKKMTAAEILDPWLNTDPCKNCVECERVCKKLKDRIEAEISKLVTIVAARDFEIANLQDELRKWNEADSKGMQALIEENDRLCAVLSGFRDYAGGWTKAMIQFKAKEALEGK